MSDMFTNLNLTDMETCYKVFRADVVKNMPLRSRRFGIEPELTAKVARRRARIYEVPISYSGRGYAEGKKIGWKDGFAALWTIVKYAFVDDTENSDPVYKSLQRMEALQGYNRWLWEKIAPFIGHRILEVGAGTGNMTRYISQGNEVVATEVNPRYLQILTNTFSSDPHVRALRLDLADTDLPVAVGNGFDTAVCLNVLEHVENDAGALLRLHSVLDRQGRLVLIVPAMRELFGEIDRALGHFRRYEAGEIANKLVGAGFEVEHLSHFNTIGMLGWYVNSRLLRRKTVPGLQARLNSWLVPLLRLEDRFEPKRGMSMLVVARRRESPLAASELATGDRAPKIEEQP
jgi:SAM-dependent methyltransferase